MDYLVITIEQSGRTHALETPNGNLAFLGRKEVKRATLIEFNAETQLWDVRLCGEDASQPHPAACDGYADYDTARRFEVDWLQGCALLRVHPLSAEGQLEAFVVQGSVRPLSI